MKRILSLALAVALICAFAAPVYAADDNSSGWIELLEFTSIQSNGMNFFSMSSSSGSVTILLQGSKRLRKVDVLLWNPTGQRPTTASCTFSGKTTNLDIYAIGSNLTRICGYIPEGTYSSITLDLKKSTTTSQTYEVLSWKVTPLGTQEFQMTGEVYIQGGFYGLSEHIYVPCDPDDNVVGLVSGETILVRTKDWNKYDTVSIWGSCQDILLNSVRVTLGTAALPFDISYFEALPSGNLVEIETYDGVYGEYDNIGNIDPDPRGKILFCVTIDLDSVDRASADYLNVFFTGHYDDYLGYSFNCQYINGSITTADTTSVTWWTRFTSFMNNLFGAGDGQESIDNLQENSASISQSASDINDFEQSQQAVLDTGFTKIQSAVTFTNFSAALVFVQRYANMTFNGISGYAIVFTLPLFLGIFFYLCSRIPGATRWRTRPPRSKGGDSP